MGKKLAFLVNAGLCAATTLCVSSAAVGQETVANHTLGSGPNVYRVEVRNLHFLEVLEAGDSDGVGELHELGIQLQSFNPDLGHQSHRQEFSGTQLYILNGGGIVSGRRNFPIRVGQRVYTTNDPRRNDVTQMWVHVYSNPNDAAYNSRLSNGRAIVTLSIEARELDCAGQRVCSRGNSGTVRVNFEIPEFTGPPSNRCGPDNTFLLAPTDGELQITGLSRTTVFSNTNSHSWYLGTNHKKGGPRLQPFNADICIASTTRQQALHEPGAAERDAARGARHR